MKVIKRGFYWLLCTLGVHDFEEELVQNEHPELQEEVLLLHCRRCAASFRL